LPRHKRARTGLKKVQNRGFAGAGAVHRFTKREAPERARTGTLAAPGLLLLSGGKTKPKPNQGIDPYPGCASNSL